MTTALDAGVDAWCFTIAPPSSATELAQVSTERRDLPTIATDDDLDAFLLDYFQVQLPRTKCCANHQTPWDAFHNAYFARSPVCIWKASRGFGGKSFTLALLGLTEALTLRADVNVLGGSGEQSKRVLENMGKLWDVPTAPREFLEGDPGAQKQTLIWKNRIQALLASQRSVRGPHPQRLRMDEIDEADVEIVKSALGQPMNKGWVLAQVVLSSTHQYADGTMTWALKQAAEKGWPVFEWCLEETREANGGWLSDAEIERKRSIMTADHWNTEVLMQEPTSEGRAFDTDCVERAFRADLGLEERVDGGQYAHGADWAKKVNHTVTVTIRKDVRPMRVVAVRRQQKKPWPAMVAQFDRQVKSYGGGTAAHDNTGLGQVVDDLLTVNAEPFDMVGRARADLLSEYVNAIEKGDLLWPRDDSHPDLAAALSEHKYCSRDALYKGSKDGSGRHHLPDVVSAAALAWRAASGVEAAGALGNPGGGSEPPTQHQELHLGRLSGYVHGGRPPGRRGFGRRPTDPTED
jgi:hypothetical protein